MSLSVFYIHHKVYMYSANIQIMFKYWTSTVNSDITFFFYYSNKVLISILVEMYYHVNKHLKQKYKASDLTINNNLNQQNALIGSLTKKIKLDKKYNFVL